MRTLQNNHKTVNTKLFFLLGAIQFYDLHSQLWSDSFFTWNIFISMLDIVTGDQISLLLSTSYEIWQLAHKFEKKIAKYVYIFMCLWCDKWMNELVLHKQNRFASQNHVVVSIDKNRWFKIRQSQPQSMSIFFLICFFVTLNTSICFILIVGREISIRVYFCKYIFSFSFDFDVTDK